MRPMAMTPSRCCHDVVTMLSRFCHDAVTDERAPMTCASYGKKLARNRSWTSASVNIAQVSERCRTRAV